MEVTREPESADHVLPLFRSNNNKHFSSFKSIHHCRCFVLAIRKWWETDLHNQIINQTDQHNWSDRYNPYQYRSTLLTAFRLEYISFWSHRWKYVIFSSVMRTGEGGGSLIALIPLGDAAERRPRRIILNSQFRTLGWIAISVLFPTVSVFFLSSYHRYHLEGDLQREKEREGEKTRYMERV